MEVLLIQSSQSNPVFFGWDVLSLILAALLDPTENSSFFCGAFAVITPKFKRI